MSHEEWPSDQELQSISRMARESSDFFDGLARMLRPQESHPRSEQSAAAPSVEQAETKAPRRAAGGKRSANR
jgi:hypothetical protein